MNNLILAFAALAALAWSVWLNDHHEPTHAPFIDDRYYIPCGHGCQHAPFYRGSSRKIRFYSATPENANAGFQLIIEEANKEGGTIIFGTNNTTIDGGDYHFCSGMALIDATGPAVTVKNTKIHIGANC